MKRISVLIFALSTFALSGQAYAWCMAPDYYPEIPQLPFGLSKPEKPFCMTSIKMDGATGCSDWEKQSYIDARNTYLSAMEQYARDAKKHAAMAQRFADQVVEYTQCQTRDLKQNRSY